MWYDVIGQAGGARPPQEVVSPQSARPAPACGGGRSPSSQRRCEPQPRREGSAAELEPRAETETGSAEPAMDTSRERPLELLRLSRSLALLCRAGTSPPLMPLHPLRPLCQPDARPFRWTASVTAPRTTHCVRRSGARLRSGEGRAKKEAGQSAERGRTKAWAPLRRSASMPQRYMPPRRSPPRRQRDGVQTGSRAP